MRIASAAAALVLLSTLAANAQARRPVAVPQTVPPATGITEQGHGEDSAQTDRLALVVDTFSGGGGLPGRDFPIADRPATPGTPTALEREVVEQMRASGIDDARVVSAALGSLSAPDRIFGTLAKPSTRRLAEIERRVIAALPAAALSSLQATSVTGELQSDGCGPAIDRARAAAFADARKRAEAVATLGGVRLGAIVATSETDQTAGCTNLGGSPLIVTGNNGPFGVDAPDLDRVNVSVNLTITFSVMP